MEIPASLRVCLARARQEVENHPLHHLEPCWRFDVYSTLNVAFALTLSEARKGESVIQVLPAFHLSTLATRHVLPLWEHVWPDNDLPHLLLVLSVKELFRDYSSTEAGEFLRQSEDILIGLSTDEEEEIQNRVCVGISAKRTAMLAVAYNDSFVNAFALKPEDQEWGEGAFDIYSSDAAKWAAIACAGGIWLPCFDRKKSREFWLWWLEQAVRKTWRLLLQPT